MNDWRDSFDGVAKRYAGITPLRGARKAQDIRPLGERRYWWNRIIKVNDNKYVLSDGMWFASAGTLGELTAPIVWERKDDGDYMTLRNCPNDSYSTSRFSFLDYLTPNGMSFWYDNGKHWIRYQGKDHYLPKFKAKFDWQNGTADVLEDNKIVFKHTPEGMVRVNELQPMKTKRIDKELTKQYDPKIESMWAWMQAVLPVLGDSLNDWQTKNEYANTLLQSDGHGGGGYWYWTRYIKPTTVREILDNEEHDLRMSFAVMCAYQCDLFSQGRFEADPKGLSALKKLIRKIGGMLAVELR